MARSFRGLTVLAVFAALALTPILPRAASAAGTAELLADLNVSPPSGFASEYGARGPLVPVGDRVLFFGYEPSTGQELWVSDGTSLGTRLLRELAPGTDSPLLRWIGTVRQNAVFVRDLGSGSGPFEVWSSDGTVAGTSRIAGSGEAGFSSCAWNDLKIAQTGNRLFFLARRGGGPCELWRTDGTRQGSVLVESLPGEIGEIQSLIAAGNRLFFSTADSLWTSDGTAAGTLLVRRFDTADTGGPRSLTATGSRAVFLARAGEDGEELWISDGTARGTRSLTRFFEPFPFDSGQPLLKPIGNRIYFTATDGTGFDLWRTDGSAAAPARVTDFVHSRPFGERLTADRLVALGERLIFPATEGNGPLALWVSGGTPQSTSQLNGCADSPCPTMWETELVPLGNRVLFLALDSSGPVLWSTDGTNAGTRRLAGPFCYTSCGGSERPRLAAALGKVFFVGNGGRPAGALWKSDGTVEGTGPVIDLGPNSYRNNELFSPVQVGRKMFFIADASIHDIYDAQLWVSDGSAAGTGMASMIEGGEPASSPFQMTPFGSGFLFGAYDGTADRLWHSDGTSAGTVPVPGSRPAFRTFAAGAGLAFFLQGESSPRQLWRTDGTGPGTFRVSPDGIGSIADGAMVGNRLLFFVWSPTDPARQALWQSDGTPAGTHALFDLPADMGSAGHLRAFGGRLYFVANKGNTTGNEQLWVSDGTAAGTLPLTRFRDYAFDFREAPPMAQVGGTLYFVTEYEFWKTDGTVAGTVKIPLTDTRPTDLLEFQGSLFFLGPRGTGTGLWRTDGTAAGTTLVKALGGTIELRSAWLTKVGNRFYFVADDGEHGDELWVSDGTAAGTVLVRDIAPGAASSLPTWLVAAGNRVFFSAYDGESGFELWESDGTAAGTRQVHDIAPGGLSSYPKELAVSGGKLLFAADDGLHGEEPWIYPLNGGGGCATTAGVLCLGNRFRVEAHWRDFQGNRGKGHPVGLTGDTGYFWFFDAANVEVILKVLDGRGVNDHHWVFYGALSNVEYTLTVTDTQTGAVRRYINPPGRLGSVADTEAFGPRGASTAGVVTLGPAPAVGEALVALRGAAEAGTCAPASNRLCLNGGRFAVEARWKAGGRSGAGQAVALPGGDTGYFWFFEASNVEVVLKVLDGQGINGHHWVFYGALSDVEYTLTVTDTVTGTVKTYTNPAGRLASVADTEAF